MIEKHDFGYGLPTRWKTWIQRIRSTRSPALSKPPSARTFPSPATALHGATTRTAVFKAFTGEFRITGGVSPDGAVRIVTDSRADGPAVVRLFDPRGNMIRTFRNVLPGTFPNGVNVSVADVNGDNFDDIIVSARWGREPIVTALDGRGIVNGVADPEKLLTFVAGNPKPSAKATSGRSASPSRATPTPKRHPYGRSRYGFARSPTACRTPCWLPSATTTRPMTAPRGLRHAIPGPTSATSVATRDLVRGPDSRPWKPLSSRGRGWVATCSRFWPATAVFARLSRTFRARSSSRSPAGRGAKSPPSRKLVDR